jgi:hypothetical protein
LLLYCFKVWSIARTQLSLEKDLENNEHSENVPNGRSENVPNGHLDDQTTVHSNSVRVITVANPSNSSGTDPVFRTLYRVLTVTLFYEIACIVIFCLNNITIPQLARLYGHSLDPWLTVGELLLITTWTLSAHLMLDHNDTSYLCFIEGLHSAKLHYCCVCYRHIVVWQLGDLRRKHNHKEALTVDLKSGGPGLPDNDSYQTCTNTSELERTRKKNKEFLDHVRKEKALHRINGTQKEGR